VSTGSLLPIEVQEKMRNRKNDLSVMMRRITSARNTVNVLTEDDEEMALMNLTVLRNKPHLYQYVLPYCTAVLLLKILHILFSLQPIFIPPPPPFLPFSFVCDTIYYIYLIWPLLFSFSYPLVPEILVKHDEMEVRT
jgi:hypothetical protein